MLTRVDAEHAKELYDLVRQIDGRLEHVRNSHRFIAKIDVWATVSTGNYPIELEVRRDSPSHPAILGALEADLMRQREIRCEGLTRLGFEAPPPKEKSYGNRE